MGRGLPGQRFTREVELRQRAQRLVGGDGDLGFRILERPHESPDRVLGLDLGQGMASQDPQRGEAALQQVGQRARELMPGQRVRQDLAQRLGGCGGVVLVQLLERARLLAHEPIELALVPL